MSGYQRGSEAKRFGSQREAGLWCSEYGKEFESYRRLDIEQLHEFGFMSPTLILMSVGERR
jgi:hypothetical protein